MHIAIECLDVTTTIGIYHYARYKHLMRRSLSHSAHLIGQCVMLTETVDEDTCP